jgi:hypothetical protein
MGSRKQTSRDLEWITTLAKAKSDRILEELPEGEGWKTFPELNEMSNQGKHQLRETLKMGVASGKFEERIGKRKNCLGNLYKIMFYRIKNAE